MDELPDDMIHEIAKKIYDSGDVVKLIKFGSVNRRHRELTSQLLANLEPLIDYFSKLNHIYMPKSVTTLTMIKSLNYYLVYLTKYRIKGIISEYQPRSVPDSYGRFMNLFAEVNMPFTGVYDIRANGIINGIYEQNADYDNIHKMIELANLIKETWSDDEQLVAFIESVLEEIHQGLKQQDVDI